jgi:hypothetical protein
MWRTLAYVWDDVFASYYPERPEVFLNPDDWREMGEPAEYMGAPVLKSIGVPRGSARIFCRGRLEYLPPTRAPYRADGE